MTGYPSRPLHAAPKPVLSRGEIALAMFVGACFTVVLIGALLAAWQVNS